MLPKLGEMEAVYLEGLSTVMILEVCFGHTELKMSG